MSALTDILVSGFTIPDLMIRFAISNAAVALPLGFLAWWTQARANRPFLSHLLWLIVLLKLVTPPLYALPLFSVTESIPLGGFGFKAFDTVAVGPGAASNPAWWTTLSWKTWLVAVWLIGSAAILAWSLVNAVRFDRLLRKTSAPLASEWQEIALAIAASLGLRRTPDILTTAANISPMVWWVGGPVRIYVPHAMFEQLDGHEIRSILTHELGHVRRGDHFVRWLEWLVCITLWWNPIAWWARRNLRACEEICCDAFVLSKTGTSRDSYASALVNAMELLAAPMIRPSGMASRVNGGLIERRIRMILSSKSLANTPGWLRGLVLTSAVVVLPLGFTIAQEYGDIERVEQWLASGVNSAYVTQEQADIMLAALRIAEKQSVRLISSDGKVNIERIPVETNPKLVALYNALHEAEVTISLAWAEKWFLAQVESGQITRAEADAMVEDIKSAIASGLTDGPAFYEQQFELGLIDRETADRRLRTIQEMEGAWNRSPENAALQAQKLEMLESQTAGVVKRSRNEHRETEAVPAE